MRVKGHENARLPVPLGLVIFPGVQTKPASAVVTIPPSRPGASSAGHADPAALEARLDEFPLDVLLGLVAGSRRSGVLEIDGPRPVLLYFADGDLCGGESLDDPTLRAAVAGVSPGGRRDAARIVVEDHLVTALAATLIPSAAQARFRPGPADPELSRYRFRIDTMIAAAHDRVEAWRVIADVIPSTETVLSLAPDLPDTLDQVLIERADWQVLSCVDGTRTVADVVTRSGRSAFDVCSALYRMIVLGVIALPR